MGDLPRHSVSVTGIVFRDDGRVLVIQRADDGRWVPPGSLLELSETPPDGVAREVLEETGIQVKVDKLTGVYKNMIRGVVTLAFRCYATGGETHPTGEARQVVWLTVDEATRDMVEAALSGSPTRSAAMARTAGPRRHPPPVINLLNAQRKRRQWISACKSEATLRKSVERGRRPHAAGMT
jgi:8-oxo-dGTP diphosphatase